MHFHRVITRPAVLALAVLFLAPAALAQQADRPVERLVAALELTEAQTALVQEHLAEGPRPGALWHLAAALTPTLTQAQKERLFAPPRREAVRRADRPARERVQAGMQAQREAMHEALGLTPEQIAALETARAERRDRAAARRSEEGPLAGVLTDEQREIVAVHRALMRHLAVTAGRGPRVAR